MFIISIGGNIGCGKTTILEKLRALAPDVVFEEPIDKWGAWLEKFYENPTKSAFPFQMKVLLDFLYFDKTHADKVVVTERSPLDSLYVFGKTLCDANHISEMEYNLFEEYVQKIGWKPDVYIYLQADPDVCLDRIQTRARACEKDMDPSYIHKIHYAHEEMSMSLKLKFNGTTVDIINANQNPEKVWEEVQTLLKTKYDFPTNSV